MVGDSIIVSSNSARNLGVIFDKCIKLDRMNLCILSDLRILMIRCKLKINDSKTEF